MLGLQRLYSVWKSEQATFIMSKEPKLDTNPVADVPILEDTDLLFESATGCIKDLRAVDQELTFRQAKLRTAC